MSIRSFRDRIARNLFTGRRAPSLPPDLVKRAGIRLAQLDAAERLADLKVPPSLRLESLRGNRAGQYSIRINRQWRVCFRWHRGDAWDVEIVDYHD